MPVAAIHEDSYPGAGEDEIRPPVESRQRPDVDAVAQPQRMNRSTHRHLRRSVPATVAPHDSPRRRR